MTQSFVTDARNVVHRRFQGAYLTSASVSVSLPESLDELVRSSRDSDQVLCSVLADSQFGEKSG